MYSFQTRVRFSEVDSSRRADFYSGIQRVQPFLLPASEKAVANAQQAADASGARYLFYKPLRYYSCPIAPHLVGYLDADGAGFTARLPGRKRDVHLSTADVLTAAYARGDQGELE